MPVAPRATPAKTLGGIYLSVPFDPGFVTTLKGRLAVRDRIWHPEEKRWYITSQGQAEALRLAHNYWPEFDDAEVIAHEASKQAGRGEAWAGGGQAGQQRQRQRYDEPLADFFRRMGFQDEQRARQQQNATPPPAQMPSGLAGSFATLHLMPTAPAEVVKAVYKALALKHHPDKGGSIAAMQAVNSAMDALKKAGKA